ncbi:regulator of chromosome condensation RCC1 [Labilithrix luteola]|uniref:Regulator of chromosome condensation RCC1 n=1 Tax=Labilithrix luteola TaxID=1391654 RepID=A0A0K1PL04_9BACT|nr:hypothetical protein [Labilithrix luteola]AKU93794.1 regulator of chromosome condensation RCC1 [Labilithrix luteola]
MIRRHHLTLVATGLALGMLATVVACSSSDDGPNTNTDKADGGDAGDAAAPTDSARPDAAEAAVDAGELVDASVPAITCATSPCAVEIAAGADSACVRMSDGTVRCWGSDIGHALGRSPDSTASTLSPAPVGGLTGVTQLSGSASYPGDVYCALRTGGEAVCWGSNDKGVLGRVVAGAVDVESSPTPAPIEGLGTATGIFAGERVSCATHADGEVSCWGSNEAGQIPSLPRDAAALASATKFALGSKGSALAVAGRGTIALTESGLVSWGLSGTYLGSQTGVLGREVSWPASPPDKIELSWVSSITARGNRACALSNGRVYCWGAAPTVGADSVYPAPAGVEPKGEYALTVTVGARAACSMLSNQTAVCWGDNAYGQLGGGDAEVRATPVVVKSLAGPPVRFAIMDTATCALLRDGNVQCWGQNDKGQLGSGTADALPHFEPKTLVLTP